MAAQYVVVALKVENIHSGWLSSGKLVAPKEDNIQLYPLMCLSRPPPFLNHIITTGRKKKSTVFFRL